MNSSNGASRSCSVSRLLSFWPRLISPISWYRSFALLYAPASESERPATSFLNTSRQITCQTVKFTFLHIFLLTLVGLWCYIYWMITDDAGKYLTLLTGISGNNTDIDTARNQFDQIIWRTAVKTVSISIVFGLINGCGVSLAALWRKRLCERFYNIIFRSPNGCILYDTAQQPTYDLPTQLTNDIRQFTSHLSITLFGSLFFSGFLAVSAAIIIFSVYIVQKTNGDKSGIAICFSGFAVCAAVIVVVSFKFNRTAVEQLKSKGRVRSFLQRLQTNAECVAFYASSRYCELASYMKLNQVVHRWNLRGGVWYAGVNFPLILMSKYKSACGGQDVKSLKRK